MQAYISNEECPEKGVKENNLTPLAKIVSSRMENSIVFFTASYTTRYECGYGSNKTANDFRMF